jgi:hypothetical protein
VLEEEGMRSHFQRMMRFHVKTSVKQSVENNQSKLNIRLDQPIS